MQFSLIQVCFRVGFGDVFRPRLVLSVEKWLIANFVSHSAVID